MKLTLKDRLFRYLMARPGTYVASGELQRLTVEKTPYTAQNAGRRLRELCEDGLIEVEYRKGHAYYRYVVPRTQQVRRVSIVEGRAIEVYETVTV